MALEENLKHLRGPDIATSISAPRTPLQSAHRLSSRALPGKSYGLTKHYVKMNGGMTIVSSEASSIHSRHGVRRKIRFALVVMAILVTLLVGLVAFFPRPSPLGIPPPSLYFGTPTISGNQTSGWTFLVPVHLASWVVPGQMPWLNVTFGLVQETNAGPATPYPIPEGTLLRVFGPAVSLSPPFGPALAEYNLSADLWQNGGSAAIQDGQWLVLQGMIPPGHYSGHYINDGPFGTYSGPSLVFTAAFGRAVWTMYLPLGVE